MIPFFHGMCHIILRREKGKNRKGKSDNRGAEQIDNNMREVVN